MFYLFTSKRVCMLQREEQKKIYENNGVIHIHLCCTIFLTFKSYNLFYNDHSIHP
jgi:hypothetical protein